MRWARPNYIDPKDTSLGDSERVGTGIHAKIRKGPLTFQYEQAAADLDGVKTREGYYAQLRYDWDKYTVGYRHDVYDAAVNTANNTDLIFDSVFANYRATSNVTLKAEYHAIERFNMMKGARDSFGKTIVSIVAYLGN